MIVDCCHTTSDILKFRLSFIMINSCMKAVRVKQVLADVMHYRFLVAWLVFRFYTVFLCNEKTD